MDTLDLLVEAGEKIVKRYKRSYSLDRNQVRSWLDNLPDDKDNFLVGTWGLVIAAMIEKDQNKHNAISNKDAYNFLKNPLALLFDKNIDLGDVRRIKKYLDHIESLSSDHIMEQGWAENDSCERFIYDALMQVTGALKPVKGKAHPMLEALLSQSWRPTPLLKKLDEKRSEQIRHVCDIRDERMSLADTAQGMLLAAFIPTFSTGQWISTHLIFEQLWDVHHLYHMTSIEVEPNITFIKNMALLHPHTTHRALRCLYDSQKNMSDALAETFFPLNLGDAPRGPVLDILWPLWAIQEKNSERTRELLKKHHPDIGLLFELHGSLFPNDLHFYTPSSILRNHFEALFSNNTCTEKIDFTDFEIL